MTKMNPQRIAFKKAYCNPESETFGNIYKSGLAAGFSDEYSKNMGSRVEWVSSIVKDVELLSIAEENLKMLAKQDDDIKVKADITKFLASTIGKKRFSTRQELTGGDGRDLVLGLTEEQKEKLNNLL